MNSWLCAHKTGTLSFEHHHHSILLWLFLELRGLSNYMPEVVLNHNPPNSASQIARIIGLSHWYTAIVKYLISSYQFMEHSDFSKDP
jgi:hypothetical protein